MYVGDRGKILADRAIPQLITAQGTSPLWEEEPPSPQLQRDSTSRNDVWLNAFQGGEPSPGNFLNTGPISETVCLGAVALRAGRQQSGDRYYPASNKLLYDSDAMNVTNLPEANRYLTREYRPGWEL